MKTPLSSIAMVIDGFVEQLAMVARLPNVANPYAYQGATVAREEANAIRRENLRLYLNWMAAARPSLLLVGEAPGYRGCATTGVPFTNNHLLLNELSPLTRMTTGGDGFRVTEETSPPREATAAIMWQTLRSLDMLPLLWNAFPFHTHQPQRPLSNRRPSRRELDIGAIYLQDLQDIFQPERVIAVGNCAAESLAQLGIAYDKVRHPAHGGKQAFIRQLTALLERTGSPTGLPEMSHSAPGTPPVPSQ